MYQLIHPALYHIHTQTQHLREKVSLQENQFKALVDQGRALLDSMDPQTEAEQFMDSKLSILEQRWTDLVSQVGLHVTWEGEELHVWKRENRRERVRLKGRGGGNGIRLKGENEKWWKRQEGEKEGRSE